MNALVTIESPLDSSAGAEQAPTAGPHGEGHTLFSPRRQVEFLQQIQLPGPVSLSGLTGRAVHRHDPVAEFRWT